MGYDRARMRVCLPAQMPEEFNFDPDIMELKEEIKAMQQEFIELHKNSDAIKNLSK
jgi:intraflagellar transport protein 81